jgi:hypothetical protein
VTNLPASGDAAVSDDEIKDVYPTFRRWDRKCCIFENDLNAAL